MDHDFEIDQLRAELEQLRAEVAELKEERKDWGKDPDEYRVMSQCQMELMGRVEDYRAVLEALVGALPKCLHCDEIGTKQCYEFVVCEKDADAYTTSDVEYLEPYREALRLLGRGKEVT